jgi:hypothetical protein
LRVLNQQLARNPIIGAAAASPFDQLGAVEADVVPDLAQHRGGDVDAAAGTILGDRRRQSGRRVGAMCVDVGDLEQRQAGLLGQSQSGAHHQIAERCIAGGVAAPKRRIR